MKTKSESLKLIGILHEYASYLKNPAEKKVFYEKGKGGKGLKVLIFLGRIRADISSPFPENFPNEGKASFDQLFFKKNVPSERFIFVIIALRTVSGKRR